MAEYKKCSKCDLSKSITEFYTRSSSRDGYRHQCKQCVSNMSKIAHENNKDNMKSKAKQWRDNNKGILKLNSAKFYRDNPDYRKTYYQDNKKVINDKYTHRRKVDELFRLKENIRNLIKNSLKFRNFIKKSKTQDILCCTNLEFKCHIESQWEDWMNWDNYGRYNGEYDYGWDLDHIIPLSSGVSESDIIKLNHFTNIQPLCSYVNRVIKTNNYE